MNALIKEFQIHMSDKVEALSMENEDFKVRDLEVQHRVPEPTIP